MPCSVVAVSRIEGRINWGEASHVFRVGCVIVAYCETGGVTLDRVDGPSPEDEPRIPSDNDSALIHSF